MSKIVSFSIFMLIVFHPAYVTATETSREPIYVALTAGGVSCGEFLEGMEDDEINEYIVDSWVTGFFSAISYTNYELKLGNNKLNDFSRYKDRASRINWLKNYCSANPLSSVMTATLNLHAELFK